MAGRVVCLDAVKFPRPVHKGVAFADHLRVFVRFDHYFARMYVYEFPCFVALSAERVTRRIEIGKRAVKPRYAEFVMR